MPHYKLVRGFDQIDVKDSLVGDYPPPENGDRFSIWTKISGVKDNFSKKDAKALFKAMNQWKAEGFEIVADSTQYKARRYFK